MVDITKYKDALEKIIKYAKVIEEYDKKQKQDHEEWKSLPSIDQEEKPKQKETSELEEI